MLDSIYFFIALHETTIVVVAIVIAVGAGVAGYGRRHVRRTRGRGAGLFE